MRFLDLAMAGLIGTSALLGMSAFAPRHADMASSSLAKEAQLRDGLLALLEHRGASWLIQSSPETVCAFLLGISNSSVTFSGGIGSLRCGAPPGPGIPVAVISIQLLGRQVVLEAWADGQP